MLLGIADQAAQVSDADLVPSQPARCNANSHSASDPTHCASSAWEILGQASDLDDPTHPRGLGRDHDFDPTKSRFSTEGPRRGACCVLGARVRRRNKTLVNIPSSQASTAVARTIHTGDCWLDPITQLTVTVRTFARRSATITTNSATASTHFIPATSAGRHLGGGPVNGGVGVFVPLS